MEKRILIGTSGYSYQHWKKIFYPPKLSSNKWLEHYSQHFNSVELNMTFYRLPKIETFASWHKRTPTYFRFATKGSRFITHIKRLKDCQEPLRLFFSRSAYLNEKLICILWQLPPSFKFDLERLKYFVKELKKYPKYLYSIEFRNPTWFNHNTYRFLRDENINICIADSPSFPYEEIITSNFLYLRFHGGKTIYGSEYSIDELKQWRTKVVEWLKDANTLFAFFNNDYRGFAVKNALKFKELINEKI